jgi:hypothetical protein
MSTELTALALRQGVVCPWDGETRSHFVASNKRDIKLIISESGVVSIIYGGHTIFVKDFWYATAKSYDAEKEFHSMPIPDTRDTQLEASVQRLEAIRAKPKKKDPK